MNIYTIYRATNKINNKCYIGKTSNIKRRIREHKNSIFHVDDNTKFHNAIKKYGFDQFNFEIIFQSNSKLITKKEFANIFEKFFIIENKSHYTENGYNLTWGGDGFDSDFSRKVQIELISQNKHNFTKRDDGSSLSSDRVNNKTHNWLTRPDGTNSNTDRVKAGTHHLLKQNGGSLQAIINNKKLLEKGVHVFQNSEIQSKISINAKLKKNSRESVILLRKYSQLFKLKLGSGWYLKSDEWVENKLTYYINIYGKIDI